MKQSVKAGAIDFDGVLHDPYNRDEGFRMGKPIEGAKEAMETLRRKGYFLYVHSVRATSLSGSRSITLWLTHFKIPFDIVTGIKPEADFYLDNKGLRFNNNWKESLEQIKNLEKNKDF